MSREMELLFQASRTSPMLHEAAVCVEADLRNLQGENERLKREVEAQMQAKLDAQSLLANICQAIDLARTSFDLSDTWGTAAPKIIERLTEIVDTAARWESIAVERGTRMDEIQARAEDAEAALADTRRALEDLRADANLDGQESAQDALARALAGSTEEPQP